MRDFHRIFRYWFTQLSAVDRCRIFGQWITAWLAEGLTLLLPAAVLRLAEGKTGFAAAFLCVLLWALFGMLAQTLQLRVRKALFIQRLHLVGEGQVLALHTPAEALDLGEGRREIEASQEAVAYGNEQGIEALAGAQIECIGESLRLLLYLSLLALFSPLLPALVLPLLALHLFLAQRFDRRAEHGLDRWMEALMNEAELRRASLQQSYAKDLRIWRLDRAVLRGIARAQEEIRSCLGDRESCLVRARLALGLSSLARVLLLTALFLFRHPQSGTALLVLLLTTLAQSERSAGEAVNALNRYRMNLPFVRKWMDFVQAREERNPWTAPPQNPRQEEALRVDRLSFAYGADRPLLRDLTFSLKRGEKVALIGENGVGKSTLIRLLAGFYTPQEGSIRYGASLYGSAEDAQGGEERPLLAVAFQESRFFAFSLIENLSGLSPGEWDRAPAERRARLEELLTRFGLTEVFRRKGVTLCHSYSRALDPGGTNFSGGETQRLALVRACFRESPVLFLDEPSASLDPLQEKALYEELNDLLRDRTMIFTAHRLGSTGFCDRILFLKRDGRARMGTFAELLAGEESFAALWKEQAKAYREEEGEETARFCGERGGAVTGEGDGEEILKSGGRGASASARPGQEAAGGESVPSRDAEGAEEGKERRHA